MFIFLLSPHNLEYCVNIFFFFLKKKRVLEPGRLEYCVNSTRVYQARVPQKFFLSHKSNSAVPRWKTNEELEFLKLEFLKKRYFAIYFRNSVLLLKIFKNCGIGPFWPLIKSIFIQYMLNMRLITHP